MLNSKADQYSLSEDGFVLWQSKPGSPLPGEKVAKLVKGDHALKPSLDILENEITKDLDKDSALRELKHWLNMHLSTILESLVALGAEQGMQDSDDPVKAIASIVYDGLGIVPREELESHIQKLDAEQRAQLRQKKIRLGPVLVFMPLLNKPAAVRLRALLWSLYHDKDLPAQVPADGIVSVAIGDSQADPKYYRSIGYPLYGGRAVRIDMLDRVINSVYEHAEKGKFQARHEMAEWLGCSIDSLYAVLESMGHTKVYDPQDEKKDDEVKDDAAASTDQAADKGSDKPSEAAESDKAEADKAETDKAETEAADVQEDAKAEGAVPAGEEKPVETKEAVSQEDVKPELATFRLKKGKAFETGKSGGKSFKGRKDKDFDKSKSKPYKGKKKGDKKDKKGKGEREARIISFEAKPKEEDNPFAVLQQLKAKSDD